MAKFTWQDGTLVSKAKVEIGGVIYDVEPEEYSGTTPLSAANLNTMQDGIYEDLGDKSQLNTKNKTNLVSAINEIVDKKILWTNPNPTNDFDSQTVELLDNVNNYKYLIIEFLIQINRGTIFTGIIEDYSNKQEFGTVFNQQGKIYGGARLVEIRNNNTIYIEACYGELNLSASNKHAGWLIPQRIIGIN